jgi:hypothetical protein
MRIKIEVPKILQPVPVDGKICAMPTIILSIPTICNISYGARFDSSESLKIYNHAFNIPNITRSIPKPNQ